MQAKGVTIEVRRILVPLDFSDNTEAVLEWAAHLAEEHGSRVVLLHAYHLPVEFQQLEGAYLPDDFWANVKSETEQTLRATPSSSGRGASPSRPSPARATPPP